jgi:5'-deoxynucleotidase YfbR-like HD superfamily hydrolase
MSGDCGKDPVLERRRELARWVEGIHSTFERLLDCKRWVPYSPNQRQTSAHHTLSLTLLTAYCLEIERKVGKNEIDALMVMAHVPCHDFNEGTIGDVLYIFKHDPRIEEIYEQIELEETLTQMERLGFLAEFLRRAYCLPVGSVEARFFAAMERLDYALSAIFEIEVHGNGKNFLPILYRSHTDLMRYVEEFSSVAEVYNPEVRDWAEGMFKINPWAKDGLGGKIKPLDEAGVEAMIRALVHAVGKLAAKNESPEETRARLAEKIREVFGQ